MPRPLLTPKKDPVPIVQEAGWTPGPVWTGAENLVPTGIRSPDRPARSQSLYRLRYPAHRVTIVLRKILTTQVILDYLNMRVQSHLLLAQVHYLHMSQGSYYTHNQ